MRAALAARAYRPRTRAARRRARPRGHGDVPAHLRARRARATRRCSRAATAARCRSSRRSCCGAPTRSSWRSWWPRWCRCGWWRGWARELRHPRVGAGLPLPQRARGAQRRGPARRATASAWRVLGPNGAGKTTLMLHLNGLMRGSGALEVAGVDVGDKTLPELRRRVGVVFQDPDDQLFMPTVEEDVAFGPLNMGLERDEARERVSEALGAVRMRGAAPARALPALDGRAPPRGDRHRARHAPAPAGAGRALGQPRSARAPRAARRARPRSSARCW